MLLLLLSSAFIFPACGSNEVKSQKAAETVLKSDKTVPPPPMVSMSPTVAPSATQTASATKTATGTDSDHSYTSHKSSSSSSHTSAKRIVMTKATKKPVPMMAAPLVTPVPTQASMPMETFTPVATAAAPKKSGSHWPLIIAIIALVAAVGFYFWTKKAPPHNDFPLPPMGGLSPVSGFTAMRNKVQQETKKQSIWNKKLF